MNNVINEVTEILSLLYKHNWDERNGGNLSYILSEEEVKTVCDPTRVLRSFEFDFDMSPLIGTYFIVTGTGKYFKNCLKDPENNLGILKVVSKSKVDLLWGYTDGGKMTSEFPTHLMCHIERLKQDPQHRLVIHCHPTNLIAMTHICPLDSRFFTEKLWKMQTESIVVFPEGVAVLPWMVCGGNEIGVATAKKMAEGYRSVIWAHHGLSCTGRTLDEVYGLIETIEKAAEIYLKVFGKEIIQSITDRQLRELAKAFNIEYRKGIID